LIIVSVVIESNTISQEETMMIQFQNTSSAFGTMVSSKGFLFYSEFLMLIFFRKTFDTLL